MTERSVRASRVVPGQVPMVWRERIPAATLTVLAGKSGLGKSSVAGLIAAELSQLGLAVLLSDLEDDMAAVVRPRLDVVGADLERVHLIPPDAAPVLPRDMAALADLVRDVKATALVLDPIGAHFTPERRVYDRPTLRRLVQLARDTRCAVIGVHHTVKNFTDPLDALGGPTGGLGGTARAVYMFGYDPDDADRRALACVKINGVDRPPALLLDHETVEYQSDGQFLEAGRLSVVGESNATARRVTRRPARGKVGKERDEACAEWLSKFVAAGDEFQRRVQEVRDEARKVGFSWQTLHRASVTVKLVKQKVGSGPGSYWTWHLPAEHPLRRTVEA